MIVEIDSFSNLEHTKIPPWEFCQIRMKSIILLFLEIIWKCLEVKGGYGHFSLNGVIAADYSDHERKDKILSDIKSLMRKVQRGLEIESTTFINLMGT